MARRTTYTEEDKARVYVVLTANDGIVKRTARETGVPDNTVRRWRDEWEKNGPPSTGSVELAANDFITEAEDLRFLGLRALRAKLDLLLVTPKDVNVAQVTTLVGILTDKIDRAAGINRPRDDGDTKQLGAEQIRELLVGYTHAMQELSASREEEIIDAEIVEPRALPA